MLGCSSTDLFMLGFYYAGLFMLGFYYAERVPDEVKAKRGYNADNHAGKRAQRYKVRGVENYFHSPCDERKNGKLAQIMYYRRRYAH